MYKNIKNSQTGIGGMRVFGIQYTVWCVDTAYYHLPYINKYLYIIF